MQLVIRIQKQNLHPLNELLDTVWGGDYEGDTKIVDVNIRRIRSKIEEDSGKPKYIATVWGIGYRWKV